MPKVIECGFDKSGADRPPAEMLTLYGPTVMVDIGFDPLFDPHTGGSPALAEKELPGLIDTGASDCFVDAELVRRLQLPFVESRLMSGSGAEQEPVSFHKAHIHFPPFELTVLEEVGVVPLHGGGHRHSLAIGRSLLKRLHLNYDGQTGAVQLILP